MRLIIILGVIMAITFSSIGSSAKEVGFIEDFSLAADRREALKQLIPGEEDYYYFYALNAQNTGDFDTVQKMLQLWIKRYGYTRRVKEILNRQALIDYESNPKKSLKHIIKELNIQFNHQKESEAQRTDYPSTLDPNLISIPFLTQKAFSRYQNLGGIDNRGLYQIDIESLTPERRRDLLSRIEYPAVTHLPQLIVDDLRFKHSGGFGSLSIHEKLTKEQLETCRKLMPELGDNSHFIRYYLTKLLPSNDIDVEYDLAEKQAYLERLWNFGQSLSPAHNSLKANILYHLLDLKRKGENYEMSLFMTYIKLPRNVYYMDDTYLDRREFRNVQADLDEDFSDITPMPPVYSDEELVRDYLSRFFADARDYKQFSDYIEESFLKKVFVETKILNGVGDSEQWYSMMDPQDYKALKDRVELDFLPSNKTFFQTDEPVKLEVQVKNVETLIVKIFELNTFNYYRAKMAEIDTAVDLDGMTATYERVENYKTSPLQRVHRSFEFPRMKNPGVYVVEFIGNGKSSRAVIRKGKLTAIDRVGAAGHEFMVYDETNRKRPTAVIWMAGRQYSPDDKGVITIPFSTNPGRQTIILKDGEFCSLSSFFHQGESYRLSVGFYVDRESLLKQRTAKVLIRPMLSINGNPTSLSLLEDVRLIIESRNIDDVSSSREVPDFKIYEDRDSVFEFRTPERLKNIRFTVKGRIQNISGNEKETLSDATEFMLNQIDSEMIVKNFFLTHAADGYHIEVRGKNGESQSDYPVNITFKHSYFSEPIQITLQTDPNGQIQLGELQHIEWIKLPKDASFEKLWQPVKNLCHYPEKIFEISGKKIRLPFDGSAASGIVLFEIRGKRYYANHSNHTAIRNGFIEIEGLRPGDYQLLMDDFTRLIEIKITDGQYQDGYIMSDHRILESVYPRPLSIANVDIGKTDIRIRLENYTDFSRVHVWATRFMPAYNIFSHLDTVLFPTPYEIYQDRPESQYISARDIGEEYRYILERKYADTFPGNMLNRPELLLNPWDIRKTETAVDDAAKGEAPESRQPGRRYAAERRDDGSRDIVLPESFSNLDFMAETSAIFLNLKPDDNGEIVIDKDLLKDRQQLHLIAVDPLNTVYKEVALPERQLQKRDLRLVQTMDPAKHYTEQKQISIIKTGERFELDDIGAAEFETYDSLESVYRLMMTETQNTDLETFGFILRWRQMDDAEKQEKYSEYACHELNFFIYSKDRNFFDTVVRPYLENKKDKTFMDLYLLDKDLSPYFDLWAFSRLNVVEKILLARRYPKRRNQVTRHIQELFETIPPDPDTFDRLFNIALHRGDLDDESIEFEMMADADAPPPEPSSITARAGFFGEEDAVRMASPTMDTMAMSDEVMVAEAPPVDQREAKKDYFKARREKRKTIRPLYAPMDKTKEWAENNYYHLPIDQQTAELITVNAFWNDFAHHDFEKPFYSGNFIYATNTFSEMMLAISVLNLPFTSKDHPSAVDGNQFSLKAESPMIIFHKEVTESDTTEEKSPMMVNRNYFDPNDRHRYDGNERFDKYVDTEFKSGIPYGCQLVLGNPTSSLQKIKVLVQIPEGAIPIDNGFYTKGIPLTIDPFETRKMEYFFYFPEPGDYTGYPVQVSKNEKHIAGADAFVFHVVKTFTHIDKDSWEYVSQNAAPEDVIEFLKTHNIHRLDLEKIAFRMKDKAFFEKTVEVLSNRNVYHHTLWSYSIYHDVPENITEYLAHSGYAGNCGLYIDSALLSIDPVSRHFYQHLEYKPLVNARTHQLGQRQKILNDRFYEQYHSFMHILSYHPELNDEHLLSITYYLLLQDRVKEALTFYRKIDPENIDQTIQFDYLSVYMDFYTRNLEHAEEIIGKYKDYPVPRWRNFFRYASDQLNEIKGKTPGIIDEDSRDQRQTQLAATEVGFDFDIENKTITILYQNMTSCRVNYYPMDIELLFSRNPFVRQKSEDFTFIRPNQSAEIDLPPEERRFTFELPAEFHHSNLMIEIVSDGVAKSKVYYAHSLDVRMMENYGHIKVTNPKTVEGISGVYIKVYARMTDGRIVFYKDGYTDLRGRFDYVSLSTDELNAVDKFSILIKSENYGAMIREASPPKR